MHVHAAFAVGIMVVALTGYLVRVWWIYQIILSICTSPFLLFCWKFPETPFYLMAKGRYKEAQALLEAIARFNGLDYTLKVEELLEPEERENGRALLKEAEEQPSQSEKKLSILDLFGSWRMAGRTCTVWAIWFIGSLGYYVFSLGSVNLGGNQYINLFLAGKCLAGECEKEHTWELPNQKTIKQTGVVSFAQGHSSGGYLGVLSSSPTFWVFREPNWQPSPSFFNFRALSPHLSHL